jgi:hypothetical protein
LIEALHEAAHAVIARHLGVMVLHAIAEGDNPHVRTRSPWGPDDVTKVKTLERQAIIDLADAAVEDDPKSEAASADIANAIKRCEQIIDVVGRGDAAKLLSGLAERAAEIVIKHRPEIDRLAERLAEAGEMSGEQIDAILVSD